MLFHPFSVRSLEEDDGLFQGHIKLLFRYRVLDNLQGRFVDILRQHLVSTLERIDGINQIDAQLVDVNHSVCQFDEAITFRLLLLIVCRSIEVDRISLIIHHFTTLDKGIKQQALTNFFHFVLAQIRILFTNHFRNERFGDGFSRSTSADGFHHQFVLQDRSLQIIQLLLYYHLRLLARQRFQALYHQGTGIQRTTLITIHILHRLEMPARRHHLLHQKRCGNGFQKVVHRHLHIGLIGIRHSYHVHKLSRFLAFAITGASSDNLHHFGQRATHTDGQTFLTPLPVETFLGSTQSDDNIYIITLLYPL